MERPGNRLNRFHLEVPRSLHNIYCATDRINVDPGLELKLNQKGFLGPLYISVSSPAI